MTEDTPTENTPQSAGETESEGTGLMPQTAKITCDECGSTLRSGFIPTGDSIFIKCSRCDGQGQLFLADESHEIIDYEGDIRVTEL